MRAAIVPRSVGRAATALDQQEMPDALRGKRLMAIPASLTDLAYGANLANALATLTTTYRRTTE